MIQYTLKCSEDHRFDSWFQSAEAFDKLKAAGMVTCSICGDPHVEKAMMAPRVRPARKAAAPRPDAETPPVGPLSQPSSEIEQALAHMKKQVEDAANFNPLGDLKKSIEEDAAQKASRPMTTTLGW